MAWRHLAAGHCLTALPHGTVSPHQITSRHGMTSQYHLMAWHCFMAWHCLTAWHRLTALLHGMVSPHSKPSPHGLPSSHGKCCLVARPAAEEGRRGQTGSPPPSTQNKICKFCGFCLPLCTLSRLLCRESSPAPRAGSGGQPGGGQARLAPRLGAGSHGHQCEATNWLISNLLKAFMLITKKKKKGSSCGATLQEPEEEGGRYQDSCAPCHGGGDEGQEQHPPTRHTWPPPQHLLPTGEHGAISAAATVQDFWRGGCLLNAAFVPEPLGFSSQQKPSRLCLLQFGTRLSPAHGPRGPWRKEGPVPMHRPQDRGHPRRGDIPAQARWWHRGGSFPR